MTLILDDRPAHRHPDHPSPHRTRDRPVAAARSTNWWRWWSWWIDCGYDSLWAGDHISFPVPILDPLLQLAQAAVVSRRLTLGTSVLLLPLRHPTPVAKQVTTLDHLTEGRFILGVGVGGEFPKEYAACDVPHNERGARLAEGVTVLRKFFTGEPVSHHGRFYGPFEDVPMRPPPRQAGGPPIWFAGRKEAALAPHRPAGRRLSGLCHHARHVSRRACDHRRQPRSRPAAPWIVSAPVICCSPGWTRPMRRRWTARPKR